MKPTRNTHPSPTIDSIDTDTLGDGIVYVRLARADSPDAAVARCHDLAREVTELGRPRLLISVSNVSGVRPFEQRDDLALLLHHAAQDWCRWVAIKRYDRIARSTPVLTTFLAALDWLGVELHVLDERPPSQRRNLAEYLAVCAADGMKMRRLSRRRKRIPQATPGEP